MKTHGQAVTRTGSGGRSRRFRQLGVAVTLGALAVTLSGCSWQEIVAVYVQAGRGLAAASALVGAAPDEEIVRQALRLLLDRGMSGEHDAPLRAALGG